MQTSTFHEDRGLNWNININLEATITWKQRERNSTHCESFLPLTIPLFYLQDPKAKRMFSLQLLLTIYCSILLSHTHNSHQPNLMRTYYILSSKALSYFTACGFALFETFCLFKKGRKRHHTASFNLFSWNAGFSTGMA